MPKPKPFPKYPAKARKYGGGARIKINGKEYHLGPHGSQKSYAEYERLRLEHAKGIPAPPLPVLSRGMTIEQLVADFMRNEPRGVEHPENQRIGRACVPLVRLFGQTPADEFRANRLRAVQEAMISQCWMTPAEKEKCGDWSREYINKNIERIIRVFNFAESRELLPMNITAHLRTVADLKPQDKRARSCPDKQPVDWESQVVPCFPHMAPVVKAMVKVQYYAGMRPGEVVMVRKCHIDTSEDVWLYCPTEHKGDWRGHELVKVMGPQCKAAIAPWYDAADPDGFVFPPAKRRNRALHYTYSGYAHAVYLAIKEAGVKHWALHQLRHSISHAAELIGGKAASAALLGHESLETTKIYTAKQRLDLAKEVAKKIG